MANDSRTLKRLKIIGIEYSKINVIPIINVRIGSNDALKILKIRHTFYYRSTLPHFF